MGSDLRSRSRKSPQAKPLNSEEGASLAAQWLGIHVPTQEGFTCRRATRPAHRENGACVLQSPRSAQEKPLRQETHVPQPERSPACHNQRKLLRNTQTRRSQKLLK